jgi:hypothetical protein
VLYVSFQNRKIHIEFVILPIVLYGFKKLREEYGLKIPKKMVRIFRPKKRGR